MTGSDVMYWRGKPVEYLSREEAIEAVKVLVSLYYREQAPRMIRSKQELGKRGEGRLMAGTG
jgi:hypothetical protein